MVGALENTLLMLLVSLSFPTGYLIGVFTDSEIEAFAEKLHIDRVLTIYFVAIEVLVLLTLLYLGSSVYIVMVAAIIVANLIFSALHAAARTDMTKIVMYGMVTFFATIIGSLILFI
ncbi:MAG: hypothetical protein M1433_00310 [Candidatus Parvarchaeota archaeon]|nr:hypothetical protein [Candidatus Parvarchaeota archaeon]